MKSALVSVACWWISCPACQEAASDENGSQLIPADSAFAGRLTVTCSGCGIVYKVPAKVRRG